MMYQIEQRTGYQWEPIPEGDFDTEADAIAAVVDLEKNLHFEGLRIIEVE